MRAVVLSEFGPPSVLGMAQVPAPAPGPGQVLIEVEISSITFVETQMRGGRSPNPAMAPRLPWIPGNGVGGVVVAAGEGVDPALSGARVISTTGGSGGYAERVVVDAASAIAVPDGLGLAEAVALLADGRTAVGLTRAARVRGGETVLVEAAAGGVGSLLVQLARNAGASVVAAAGAPRKLDLARGLGAGVTVDYTDPAWTQQVRAQAGDVDVGEAARREVTVVRGVPAGPIEMAELTRAALAEAAAGRLRPVIGQTFPLERAADAHAAIEARSTVGKTLLVTRPGAVR
jgi:NADPH:quinone reductase